jgi:hypothetical protein
VTKLRVNIEVIRRVLQPSEGPWGCIEYLLHVDERRSRFDGDDLIGHVDVATPQDLIPGLQFLIGERPRDTDDHVGVPVADDQTVPGEPALDGGCFADAGAVAALADDEAEVLCQEHGVARCEGEGLQLVADFDQVSPAPVSDHRQLPPRGLDHLDEERLVQWDSVCFLDLLHELRLPLARHGHALLGLLECCAQPVDLADEELIQSAALGGFASNTLSEVHLLLQTGRILTRRPEEVCVEPFRNGP